jgi:cytoskeletal protein RodZ
LRALEDGRYDDLGDTSFVRGYLHSYARSLGIDPSGILDAYEREFAAGEQSPIRHLDNTIRVAKKPPRARWLLAAIVTGAVLTAVSAVGLLHGPGERPAAHTANAALPSLPPSNEAPAASRGASQVQAAGAPAQAQITGAQFALGLDVSKRCWVEVVADGQTMFSGILGAGAERSFTAYKTMKVSLGNAGAVALTFNGVRVPLDASGVWTGTFGPNGLQS